MTFPNGIQNYSNQQFYIIIPENSVSNHLNARLGTNLKSTMQSVKNSGDFASEAQINCCLESCESEMPFEAIKRCQS